MASSNTNELTGYEDWYEDIMPQMTTFSDDIQINSASLVQCSQNKYKQSIKNNLYSRRLLKNDCEIRSEVDDIDSVNILDTNAEISQYSCSICLHNLKQNEFVSSTSCGHSYHKTCIEEWIDSKKFNGCPYCKDPLKEKHKMIPKYSRYSKYDLAINFVTKNINYCSELIQFSSYIDIVLSLLKIICRYILLYSMIILLSGVFVIILGVVKSINITLDPVDENLIEKSFCVMKKLIPI